jgi:hypothetical protein
MIKSVAMSAKSIKKAKRPRVVMTLEIKLKIIADSEAGKQAVNIGHEMKARIQPTLGYFQRRRMIHNPQLLHFKFLQYNIKKLNIFLKFNSIHICVYKICINSINIKLVNFCAY